MEDQADNIAAYQAAEEARNEAESALRRERVELASRIETIDEILGPPKKPRKARKAKGEAGATKSKGGPKRGLPAGAAAPRGDA